MVPYNIQFACEGENMVPSKGKNNLTHFENKQKEENKEFIIKKGVLKKYNPNKKKPLEHIFIPRQVVKIGREAFYDCETLKSVTMSDRITEIEEGAFYNCIFLESVRLSENLTKIGDFAFGNCGSLKSIDIPEKTISIGESCFCSCASLENVVIRNHRMEIGRGAFYSSGLEKNYPDDFIIIGDSKVLLKYKGTDTHVIIPDGITRICRDAFLACKTVKSIKVPDSVTDIGKNAFGYCSELEVLELPKTKFSLGKNIVLNCSALKKISFCGYYIDDRFESIEDIDLFVFLRMFETQNFFEKYKCRFSTDSSIEDLFNNLFFFRDFDFDFESVKNFLVYQFMCKNHTPQSEEYIKSILIPFVESLIDLNCYDDIKNLLEYESGKLFSKEDIQTLIDYSILNTQKGGDISIQTYIVSYKSEHFPDDPSCFDDLLLN